MAYDRSARFGRLVTQTPAAVGPGSYDISESSKPPSDLHRAYPFLSGVTRKTLEVTKDASNLPGPGSYDSVEPRRHGGVSIDFTDTRLKSTKIYEGSGPDMYNLPDDLFKIGVRKLRSHPGTWRGPAGNLWLGKPPRSIVADNGISVPSKRDVNGYDVKRGILVKNPPCEFEPTDFYDIPRGEANFTTLRYKGNFWSMMSGRDEREIAETPGPGTYEADNPIDVGKMRDEAYRSMKKATSRQSRYFDELWRRKIRENHPAPNTYDPIKGPFDKDSTCDCDEYIVEPPAFGLRATRFEVKAASGIPGPGAYDPADAKCSSCSKICAPFGSCASRFKRRTSDSPESMVLKKIWIAIHYHRSGFVGPGSYDLTKDDVAKRIFKMCRRNYARPSMPLKFEDSISHEDAASEYSITPDPRVKQSRVYHAVFRSATSRFKEARPKADTPGPADYEPMRAFKASRDPCHFVRRSLTTPFASRTLRFPKIPEGMDLQVPGPGIYDVRNDIAQGVKGGVVGDSKVRKTAIETTPGPQRYCIHPYVESSVVRKSHNVTLGKSKILNEQKKSENPRMGRCRGKKILRWFVKPISKYEHCPIR